MGIKIGSLAELDAEAARFLASVTPVRDGATLVTLSGELGAGKTAFAKAVAGALGVEETVTSPTFVLEKIYQLPERGHRLSQGQPMSAFQRLAHIDAYRLSGAAALAPLGFDELMQDPGNLILLEWPENVAEALPKPATRIVLTVKPDGSRLISYG